MLYILRIVFVFMYLFFFELQQLLDPRVNPCTYHPVVQKLSLPLGHTYINVLVRVRGILRNKIIDINERIILNRPC